MFINRNNYEDFFLLYADGELRADEREAVEIFIEENEDLRIELEMLKALVLPIEELVFIDKSFLYKETVFEKEIQEKLLLKLDNELAASELDSINASILNNEIIKKEYDILSKTKLDNNEKIVFEEKQLLYRSEKGKVISFGWLKWAAAAIFIGFALFTGANFFNKTNKPSFTDIAKTKPTTTNSKPIDTNTVNVEPSIENTAKTNNKESVKRDEYSKKTGEMKNYDNLTVKKDKITKDEKVNFVTQEAYRIIENKKETITDLQKNNLIAKDELKISIQKEATELLANNVNKEKLETTNENMVPLEELYTKTLAISNIEKSENRILYMDEDNIKKTKVGGFFRKIKRLVERTANIKPGNRLQIAGFEIASK